MSEPRIVLSVADGVGHAELNRPEKYNALDPAMFAAISETVQAIEADTRIRAVVLSGRGDHFCSGMDISNFATSDPAETLRKMQPLPNQSANYFQYAATAWRGLSVPVVAALQGSVFGGGLQIAMGADVRIAMPTSRYSVMEIKWGIIPDMGLTETMRDTVRNDVLREWVYTGKIGTATNALEDGFVTRISEDALGDARTLAAEIADRSPDAIRASKRLMNEAFATTPAESLRLEAELQLTLLGGANNREAAAANFEKRPAKFNDPKVGS